MINISTNYIRLKTMSLTNFEAYIFQIVIDAIVLEKSRFYTKKIM